MFGFSNNSIERSLGLQKRTLSMSTGVPDSNPYFKEYEASNLPLLTSLRRLHETHVIHKGKGFNLNYFIRASVIELQEQAALDFDLDTVFITINFNREYSRKLFERANPVSYFGGYLKNRLKKFGLEDLLCVIEKTTSSGCYHAHIVITCFKRDVNKIVGELKNVKQVHTDKNGKPLPSSVLSKNSYKVELFARYINDNVKELLSYEIDKYHEETFWRHANASERARGVVFVRTFEGINAGLADYLSKSLRERLFAGSERNYYVTRALQKKIMNRVTFIIEQNKLALNYRV